MAERESSGFIFISHDDKVLSTVRTVSAGVNANKNPGCYVSGKMLASIAQRSCGHARSQGRMAIGDRLL